jgi:hypothetical protein
MLTSGVVSSMTMHVSIQLLTPSLYSYDLALSIYHLLPYLKNCLKSQRFNNDEEMMEGVRKWLSS